MLTGTITSSTSGSGQCMMPMATNVASGDQRADDGAVAKQRLRHLGDRRHHQARRGRGDAGQHAAQPRQIAVVSVDARR